MAVAAAVAGQVLACNTNPAVLYTGGVGAAAVEVAPPPAVGGGATSEVRGDAHATYALRRQRTRHFRSDLLSLPSHIQRWGRALP